MYVASISVPAKKNSYSKAIFISTAPLYKKLKKSQHHMALTNTVTNLVPRKEFGTWA
jgi:hypothetical protein